MNIGKIIKEKRTEMGLTQEELAQEFFVTRQLISKWENDKSYPDLEQVVKISDFFGLSLDALMKEDQEMVKELNFDVHKKKWQKWLLFLLAAIVIGTCSVFGVMWWIDGVILEAKDIEITSITKRILPPKEVKNEITGQMIKLPEDVEYTVYFKTTKYGVDLSKKRAGYRNYSDENGIELMVSGERVLFGGNKESSIVVYSRRDFDVQSPELNIGKSLYLFRKDNAAIVRKYIHDEGLPPIDKISKKIADWKELEQLPNMAEQN